LADHETLLDYLTELPTETSHNLLRTAEANHWNTCETKGIEFVGKLRFSVFVFSSTAQTLNT
jgi:hypothetical protein